MPTFRWRLLGNRDLPQVQAIAAEVHPGLFEDAEVFAERLRLYPLGARLLDVEGRASGYVISHPWRLESLPLLNSLLGALPASANTYFVHDLALLPHMRGTGAAALIVNDIVAHARKEAFSAVSLAAVNGSVLEQARLCR